MTAAALTICVALAVVAATVTAPLLRWLPEPQLEPGEAKLPYRLLPPRPLATAAGLWTGGLALATTASLPTAKWAPFLAVALVGSLGCVIDAATTWLPKRILHGGWALTSVTLLAATVGEGSSDWWGLARALAGSLLTGAALLLAHLFGSFGLSDARLGLLTGAVAAWLSWGTLLNALLVGSVVGALWGVVHSIRSGRGSAFPYGPSLLFGPYLAVLFAAVME